MRYGIDTNVIIRYLVQDDPQQSAKVAAFLESHCTEEEPGHIPLIVLCEVVWVLRRAYQYPKSQIVKVLENLLHTAELSIENPEFAWDALRKYKTGNADFSDYLIGRINRHYGCHKTVTLDKTAGRTDDFLLL
ncbi:MAG: PIN domain-containing protein [Methanobacteriota archaeon]|nr:MAG: PIN domain-containing protein [Euryarchaeota archaeon]